MNDLEFMFWYIIMPLFGFVSMLVFPILILIFWKVLLPKPARTLFWCARKKEIPVLLTHDSGRGDIIRVKEKRGSGLVITDKGKYKILPKYIDISQLDSEEKPKEGESPEQQLDKALEDANSKDQETDSSSDSKSLLKKLKAKYIPDFSSWIVKRVMLIGMNVPFFVGYTGKICLLNPEALALVEAGEMKIETEDGTIFKGLPKDLKDAIQPLLLLDPRRIKEIINLGFDETQIAALAADSEALGRQGLGFGKWMPIIIIVIIAIIIILGLMFLPKLLEGFM